MIISAQLKSQNRESWKLKWTNSRKKEEEFRWLQEFVKKQTFLWDKFIYW